MSFHVKSETGTLRTVLVKHVKDAFTSQKQIEDQWRELGYSGPPNFDMATAEYRSFVGLMEDQGVEVLYLPSHDQTGLDSLYTRDSLLMTPEGAIVCRMGKAARRGEGVAMKEFIAERWIPVCGEIIEPGTVEGGDVLWLDNGETLAVGHGYRTNEEGIRQLRKLTAGMVKNFVVVPLVHWDGPTGLLHLMSFVSPLDEDLALVYSRIMPVVFRERMIRRGVRLLEVPESEFESMACNVLALSPRRIVMLSGNPKTKRLLEAEGVQVLEYDGDEISMKGHGGPTCLTRPIFREHRG
jgi:N-dimethylarginine dimethylaminohydrolase